MRTQPAAITVYWRPGCPFCARLKRRMNRAGLAADWVNIWADLDAAAFVRSVAGGNETVPTVVIDSRAMVNPGINTVQEAVRQLAPDASAPDSAAAPRPARRMLDRVRGTLFGSP